jgi:UDP-N-acetylmuramoylalanine--D-glutamate ligase
LAAESSGRYEWIVAEVSSFQLAQIVHFRPAIGVLLNLCPDHLDRYVDVEQYYADKARLFENAIPSSRWVLNGEDEGVLRLASGQPGQARYFRVGSQLRHGEEGAYLAADGFLMCRYEGDEVELIARRDLRLLGAHNVANALATVLAAVYAHVPLGALRESLSDFEPLPHRLQPVREESGVLWINDSKATNVASTRVALQALTRPLILLLGGRSKGQSFSPLIPELTGRVRAVIAYGEAVDQIISELANKVSVTRVDGPFEDVVRKAATLARPGDAVLLSPACASFDMFRDYEERGQQFMELVGGPAS